MNPMNFARVVNRAIYSFPGWSYFEMIVIKSI